MVGMGQQLDMMILVVFPSLNDSMIPRKHFLLVAVISQKSPVLTPTHKNFHLLSLPCRGRKEREVGWLGTGRGRSPGMDEFLAEEHSADHNGANHHGRITVLPCRAAAPWAVEIAVP